MQATYDAVFEQHEGWWIGFTDDMPGAFGQGRTLDEARESLKEAIVLLLECARDEGMADEPPAPTVRERIAIQVP